MFGRNEISAEDHGDKWVLRVSEKISRKSLAPAIAEKIERINEKKAVCSNVVLDLMERSIAFEKIDELKAEIEQKCRVKVMHVFSNTSDVLHKRKIEDSLPERSQAFESARVLYVKKSVRCGQTLEFSGDIVVLGNVNSGAAVRARGSVTVLGECSGEIWAGADGGADPFIYCYRFSPVRVRLFNSLLIASDIPDSLFGRSVLLCLRESEIVLKRHPAARTEKEVL